ncbi:hypothetical protein [Dyadobacter frigoris]|uniref:Beta-lactamase-inhibitor-like PepSY-like domain-containing protein n=1 Tax=Dyadobacter frigoris TaxID=2576211 RepID=A0A4U6CWP1_9BACT|nr:hypothetical protein [Dyadobacter frigoris]TKT88081.1 hypothetical protein FDK13_27280 [Dyadobacter frigoris]GLU53691.1 hypothetical protein Dfri01_31520 [Dyadobacter frigoris]
MKNLIAPAIVFVFAAVTVPLHAQSLAKADRKELKAEARQERKLEADDVRTASKTRFLEDFGNVNDVKWVRGVQFDEATFTLNNQLTTAFYDFNSELVGTTMIKKFADIPANAQKEIKKRYKGYTIGAVIMFDDNESNDTNMYMYGNQFEDADHYFVTVAKGKSEIILKVAADGEVSYFKEV